MAESCAIFISHKSEHKPWVIWLAEALRACGHAVFLDIWNLVPGESWVEGLHNGLAQCRAAVLVATPEVVHSGWVRMEHARLVSRRVAEPGFRFVPIVFGDSPNLPFLADIQAVDFRDPAHYQESLHRLLCGLDGQEPGQSIKLPAAIPPPPALRRPAAADIAPGEARFLGRLMQRLSRPATPPLLVLSRGLRHQGPLIQALAEQARAAPGGGLLHITPPYSGQVGLDAYFRELGRQCGFAEDAASPTAFTIAVARRLEQGERWFLLVSGFENANAACRSELAGSLRTLTEKHTQNLRVALFGGLRLVEQKYGGGRLSFLSHAEVEEWPAPDAADVLALQQAEFPGLALNEAEALRLLDAAGGHAGQVRHGLECWDAAGGAPQWPGWCYLCREVWESWYRLADEFGEALVGMLARDDLGPALPWPPDKLARRLYWADLLKVQQGRLLWRSEIVRQVGREVLGLESKL